MCKVAERLAYITMTPAEQAAYSNYRAKSLKQGDYEVSAENRRRKEGWKKKNWK